MVGWRLRWMLETKLSGQSESDVTRVIQDPNIGTTGPILGLFKPRLSKIILAVDRWKSESLI